MTALSVPLTATTGRSTARQLPARAARRTCRAAQPSLTRRTAVRPPFPSLSRSPQPHTDRGPVSPAQTSSTTTTSPTTRTATPSSRSTSAPPSTTSPQCRSASPSGGSSRRRRCLARAARPTCPPGCVCRRSGEADLGGTDGREVWVSLGVCTYSRLSPLFSVGRDSPSLSLSSSRARPSVARKEARAARPRALPSSPPRQANRKGRVAVLQIPPRQPVSREGAERNTP